MMDMTEWMKLFEQVLGFRVAKQVIRNDAAKAAKK